MITILTTLLIIFYIVLGLILYIIVSFCGVKMNKTKNKLLIIFYPLTIWFIK